MPSIVRFVRVPLDQGPRHTTASDRIKLSNTSTKSNWNLPEIAHTDNLKRINDNTENTFSFAPYVLRIHKPFLKNPIFISYQCPTVFPGRLSRKTVSVTALRRLRVKLATSLLKSTLRVDHTVMSFHPLPLPFTMTFRSCKYSKKYRASPHLKLLKRPVMPALMTMFHLAQKGLEDSWGESREEGERGQALAFSMRSALTATPEMVVLEAESPAFTF